jgi:G3E family GTPase
MLQVSDMRITIYFGIPPQSDDAVLVEEGHTMPQKGYTVRFSPHALPSHKRGCACCTFRSPVSEALSRLFRARATGAAPFFKRVVVFATPKGEAAVREALVGDVMAATRFQLAHPSPR